MSDDTERCDCCGHSTYYAGVASTAAPISTRWCLICIWMGAQPPQCWAARQLHYGEEEWNPKTNTDFAHFDREFDQYFRGPDVDPILLKNSETEETLTWERRGDVDLSVWGIKEA